MQCENAMPELPTRCVLTFAWLLVCIVLIVLLVCWCQWVMCDMCPFVDGGLPWPLRTLSFLISRFCRPSSHYLSIRQPLIHLSLSLSASLFAHFLPLFLLSLVLSTLILEMWNTKNKWHSVGMKISYISDQLNRIQYLQCMTYDKYSYSCCVTVDDCSFNL